MKTINRRLLKLEQAFVSPPTIDDLWGSMAGARDEILLLAESSGEAHLAEVKHELDEIGPLGLWQELVREPLADRGFIQRSDESFAETVARALNIDIPELVALIHQGRIGKALTNLFNEPRGATDNGGYRAHDVAIRTAGDSRDPTPPKGMVAIHR